MTRHDRTVKKALVWKTLSNVKTDIVWTSINVRFCFFFIIIRTDCENETKRRTNVCCRPRTFLTDVQKYCANYRYTYCTLKREAVHTEQRIFSVFRDVSNTRKDQTRQPTGFSSMRLSPSEKYRFGTLTRRTNDTDKRDITTIFNVHDHGENDTRKRPQPVRTTIIIMTILSFISLTIKQYTFR